MTGELDFTCPECGKDYPTIALTVKGTCMSCGSAKKSAGGRKSLFMQRAKYRRRVKNSYAPTLAYKRRNTLTPDQSGDTIPV